MAIKIVKKRQVTARTAAPLVDDLPAPAPAAKPTSYRDLPVALSIEELWAAQPNTLRAPDPTPCKLCGHTYGFPCHGENHSCMNRAWALEAGRTPLT